MSQIYGGGFVTVTTTGLTVTSSATSTAYAIPNASDGNKPRFIRVASTAESYVKLGTSSGVTATTNDLLIQPSDSEKMFVPNGVTHIAVIQGAGAAKVNIVPLENI